MAVSLGIYQIPAIQVLEHKVEDMHYLTVSEVPDSAIILIALDDYTLDYTQKNGIGWPFPRDIWKPVLEYFADAGTKNVLFDLQFTHSDIDRAETYAENTDSIFAEAITKKGDVILGTQLFGDVTDIPEDIHRFSIEEYSALPEKDYPGILSPIKRLREAARGLGIINIEPDTDGIIRRIPLFYQLKNLVLPQMSLAPLLLTDEVKEIPVDKHGDYRIFWYGKGGVDGAFDKQYFSMGAILKSALQNMMNRQNPQNQTELMIPLEKLRDKYIIIGTTAGGLLDLKSIPTDRIYPGMEIWATTLSNFLQNDFIIEMPFFCHLLILIVTAFIVIVSFARMQQKVFFPLLIMLVLIILGTVVAWQYWKLLVPVVSILNTFIISYIFSAMLYYILEGRAKQQIRAVFSRYLSAEVIQELIRDPDRIEMGGEEVEATILFTDIANFTNFSETQSPQELVSYLNEYFDTLVDIVMKNHGLLDKYTGDGIMALFGVPIKRRNHARSACLSALTHRNYSQSINRIDNSNYADFFHTHTRIGINTGRIVAGNIGSEKRMDYTAIGDDVNLAARLESVNKIYRTSIIISESTYSELDGEFICRELDTIRVKGKDKATVIFELVAFNPNNAVKIQKMRQTCLPEEHKNLTLNIFKYAMKFLNPSRYTSSPPFSNPTTLNGFKGCLKNI
ncbi:MAG: adenylate/guanylate cyclase domain-containing protein [Candidatus Cloacimonetes bacterium]|nr:adenylate/guanylate cyclase domain-containing protein [Candidatus Cloacimonadota bacterium]